MPILVPVDDPCSFCEYLAGRRPYTVLHRDDVVAVLVTREQRGPLQLLVIPVAHRETLLDLSQHEEGPLLAAVTRAVRAIVAATDAEGVAVWQNNGVPSHQSVPHVHMHVAATLAGGGTQWGPVPELPVTKTDELAEKLRPHWEAAARPTPTAVPGHLTGQGHSATRAAKTPPEARWLVESQKPWQELVAIGPSGFQAYARLRFLPDPSRPGQPESEAADRPDQVPELEQAARALHRLAAYTSTPEDCFFLFWEGFPPSCLPLEAAEGTRVDLPHRSYWMLRGALSRIDTWRQDEPGRHLLPPAFVWPADRQWCFTRDVDPHYAGIAGTHAAIAAVLADTHLDVVPADPDQPQPSYS